MEDTPVFSEVSFKRWTLNHHTNAGSTYFMYLSLIPYNNMSLNLGIDESFWPKLSEDAVKGNNRPTKSKVCDQFSKVQMLRLKRIRNFKISRF